MVHRTYQMKTKTPYLDFYYSCMKTGRMPKDGLCSFFDEGPFDLFLPEFPNRGRYWGFDGRPLVCWVEIRYAYVGESNSGLLKETVRYSFTPLRQNIVLLCAAINGEM